MGSGISTSSVGGVLLRDVTKRYRRRVVLDGVSVVLRPGSSTVVQGSNGSGKSTLLRILAGVSAPTSGSVTGIPAAVSYLPATFAPPPLMRAAGYLTHLGRIGGLTTTVARRRAADLLELLQLAPGPAARLGGLSTGNLRKVGIAQAFLADAELIILDEPRSGLDDHGRTVLDQLVRSRVAAGATVIIADHEPYDAGHAQRLAVNGGRVDVLPVVADDEHYLIEAVRAAGDRTILTVVDQDRDRVLASLLAEGWSIIGVRRERRHADA